MRHLSKRELNEARLRSNLGDRVSELAEETIQLE